MGQTDSAAAELQTSIDMRSNTDKKRLVFVYESKAMSLYQLGWVWLAGNQTDKARDAFGQALTEELSFYRAHVAMAVVALKSNDTTQALAEYGLAADLNNDDASLRLAYGALLHTMKQYDQAATQLEKAIALDPEYAMPYYELGLTLEDAGRKADAATRYEEFVARAARSFDAQIVDALARHARLTGGSGK